MLAAFLICLREGIEIFLVVIPLMVYFNKNKLYSMTKSVILGGAVGAFLSAIIATVIFSQTALLNGPASELFDGLLGIVIAVLVLYSVVLLRKSKTFSTNPDEKFISLSRKGVSIIAGITFFRELLEATLFILTSSGTSPIIVAGMSILGLAAAALIVYVVSKGLSNLNIGIVFYILNLFLIALGAYYFGDGLEVLFSSYVPQIYTIGILVYAIPSYIIIVKKDLKKLMNSIK
jgi:high-affinity iron transporter